MLKTTCKYCKKLNMCDSPFKNMKIKDSGKVQVKSKCKQCGCEITYTQRPGPKIVKEENENKRL